jgi:NAD(P)-dependent dehydrogenase (short-subunit alcohol dehydrogenase family)
MTKVVLITGCGAGIGRTTAIEAVRRGYVVYAGVRDPTTSQPIGGTTVLALDVTNAEQRERAIERIVAERGRLDALINNAGVALGGFLELVDEDEFRHVLEVNVLGAWAMTRAALPAMRKTERSTVVFVSSVSGRMSIPGLGVYNSSKFAVEGMAEAWRHELSHFGVRVVLVEPGPYRTDIFGRNRHVSRGMSRANPDYHEMRVAIEQIYDRTANSVLRDPIEVATLMLDLTEKRAPRLRYPIGPTTRVRTLGIRFVPFGLIERAVSNVLQRTMRRLRQAAAAKGS